MTTRVTVSNPAHRGPIGTVSALVCFDDAPGKPLLLGASHVFAPKGAHPGDVLVDAETGRGMATLLDWTGLNPGLGYPNRADAALAVPFQDLPGLAGLVFARARPMPGTPLRALAPSGLPAGQVIDPVRDCIVAWQETEESEIFHFGLANQIICEPIGRPGDSGAAVVDANGALAGLLTGKPVNEAERMLPLSIVAPIDAIAQHAAWGGRRLIPYNGPAAPPAPAPPAPVVPVAGLDIDVLARTMWGEARGEKDERSMVAVAWVVINRVAGHRPISWGSGIAGVCQHDRQFSCWNRDDRNLKHVLNVDQTDPIFTRALQEAQAVVDGKFPDPTFGADHYCRGDAYPAWRGDRVPSATIGNHVFFAKVP